MEKVKFLQQKVLHRQGNFQLMEFPHWKEADPASQPIGEQHQLDYHYFLLYPP